MCLCVCCCTCHCSHLCVCVWSSGSGELGVNRRLLPVLRAALWDGGNPRVVSNGRVHGPLAGAAHVAESRVQP